MTLIVYGHPFSSYTQKVLIALYENDISFEFRMIAPDQPENTAEWADRWPIRKFPLLVDGNTTVAETSIIIEYLDMNHPGQVRFIPDDPDLALQVRFMDRFFDQHVMNAMQWAVDGALGLNGVQKEPGLEVAIDKLNRAYAWLEQKLDGLKWALGDSFTMADCAAGPSLFYADWTHEIPQDCRNLRAYRDRLLARPSFARAIDEARPFRSYFPLGAPDRD
ncbi:glutathione S-transferase family protein [Paracoccus albus]|uniref:glutathione S-transferase family protein n=1 Tax=Paracoccus albus TaxID=3017784 RepID=UPI0022F1193A|nr:glutathione S-transferase family protein [Paracoccus albus]WBU61150.1 glutathione S-transferase family protein [Paracoccus albus]